MLPLKDENRVGTRPKYTDSDILWALMILDRKGSMSRKNLSALLGVGEGTSRGILTILERCGFCERFQTGTSLTPDGRRLLERLGTVPSDVRVDDECVSGPYQRAIIVKGVSSLVVKGVEQRNAGIRAGGTGCTTVVYRDDTVFIPPDWNVDRMNPQMALEIRAAEGMSHDDALVVGSGDDELSAMRAAANAALDLVSRRLEEAHPIERTRPYETLSDTEE